MANPDHLWSWLKYLDAEYLSDDFFEILSEFDINRPEDQDEIIRLSMDDSILAMNPKARTSMLRILEELDQYPEAVVRDMIYGAGMPFKEQLKDYKAFYKRVHDRYTSK